MAHKLKSDKDDLAAGGSCEYGNVADAAKTLGVSQSFLNKARLYGGGPPFCKFGATVRYHLPTLLEWAAAQTRRTTSDGAAPRALADHDAA